MDITPEVEARFWSKVSKGDGCWEFEHRSSRSGYGQMQIGRRPYLAHRISYVIAHGPIPDGEWVLHRCNNKACVRPDHIYTGGPKENSADQMLVMGDPTKGLVCISVAARELGVTRDTLRQQIARGKLKSRKHVEHFLERSEVERYRVTSVGKRGRPAR